MPQGDSLPSEPPGKPNIFLNTYFHFFFSACCFYVVHIFLFVDEEYTMSIFFPGAGGAQFDSWSIVND